MKSLLQLIWEHPPTVKAELMRWHSVNRTGDLYDVHSWGHSCARGFISDARFGSGEVIKRTNRNTTRKWRQAIHD